MKVAEALIAWTPNYATENPTAGTIKVGPLLRRGDADWAEPFLFTGGAKYSAVRKLKGREAVANIFIEFNTLVARDGLSPQLVDEAFLVIDEYAENISPDMLGARGREEDD